MRVLLIEDDPVLGESLKEYLEKEGFEVKWVSDDRELYDLTVAEAYDIVVLDLILKYSSGEDILKGLREKDIDTPVLVLTAKRSLQDKEVCFNLGADDYITKPFEPKELILRLKAILRRKHLDDLISIGDVKINIRARSIYKENREVHISKTAWELLILLLRNRGKVVGTQTILNCIWGDKPVGTDVVRAYIKELRKVIPSEYIKTYKGVGYKLI